MVQCSQKNASVIAIIQYLFFLFSWIAPCICTVGYHVMFIPSCLFFILNPTDLRHFLEEFVWKVWVETYFIPLLNQITFDQITEFYNINIIDKCRLLFLCIIKYQQCKKHNISDSKGNISLTHCLYYGMM